MIDYIRQRPLLWALSLPARWALNTLVRIDPLWGANHLLREAIAPYAALVTGTVIDVGCGAKPYRSLFHVSKYFGLDLPDGGSRVDVWGDALEIPFRDGCADTLLCNQVLEHVREPRSLMKEAHRLLRTGGQIVLTTPQTWGLHHVPHDYYRYTRYGLTYLAEQAGFTVLHVGPTCGFWATFAQRLSDVVYNTYGARIPWYVAAIVLRLPCALIVSGGLVLDKWVGRRGDTLDNIIVARKNG